VGVQIPQILSVRTPKWFYIVRCKSIVTITGWIAGRQIIVKTTVCGGGLQTAAVSSCPISTLPVNFNPNQTDPLTDPSHAPFCFKHHDYLVSVQSHFSLTSDAKAKPKRTLLSTIVKAKSNPKDLICHVDPTAILLTWPPGPGELLYVHVIFLSPYTPGHYVQTHVINIQHAHSGLLGRDCKK